MLILIAGITGNLGQRLARVAKARGLSVRGLGRDFAKLHPEISQGLESFVKSDSYYDIPALDKAVAGVDAIICAYSPDPVLNLDGNLLLLRAAERAGVTMFIASSWNNDWTWIKFGDFEHYDIHIAFERQAAMTSKINPVYLFTGIFADLLFTPFGPGGFEMDGATARFKYWGEGNTHKWSWSTQDDVAAWTIEILLNGAGVREGKGGFFRVRSGEHTIDELAMIYEKATGIRTEVVREGSLEDIEREVAVARKEMGRARYREYHPAAAQLMGSKGLWKMEKQDITTLDHARRPTTLEEYLKTRST